MKKRFFLFLIFLFTIPVLSKQKILYVVTTTEDLADFVKNVGRDKVEVVSLVFGWQDPHRVELRPSMVFHLKKASLVVKIGMDLDSWVDNLIFASGNKKIFYGEVGYLDCSINIKKLEVPEGKVHPGMGEIHIYGNPHYWLSPTNAKVVVEEISKKLSQLMPEYKEYFEDNTKKYINLLDKKIVEWRQKIDSLENKKIVSYHKTFVYFFDFFDLKEIATIEPLPGIPPTPKNLKEVIEKINLYKPAMILHENFYPIKHTEFVSKSTGIKYKVVAVSVGGKKEIKDYITLIDTLVNAVSSIE
ncbi:MAG: metal ABC transporter substrate-binding protein [Endomicrobia bacterium]|nr:metal ABC transporter substrate-binding protein [Endomicrobiia bacterium]